ncbi:MAG: D-alanyl-D-alanine carboxypeptidase/D-alanyl-D-alanine-endopeptidase [Muribaculaceae bacterium]|nr:D-alanyl-D-alanine carboxypeptidase/D-alanyl-D-alanine-endopeptidase [Muribaculaceae bacterium]
MKLRILSAIILVGAMCCMIQARDITPERTQKAIDRFVDDSLMRHGSLGVIVVDVKSGKTLGSRNANMACITASTMKTVTSSAALELLGADYTFNTPVYLKGEIHGDCLIGDIVVEGIGDPTLGSVYFKDNLDIVNEIVEALKRQGIKEIDGRLLVDKSRYYYPAFNGDWCADDLAWDFGMGVHALNYCDNRMRLVFEGKGDGTIDNAHFEPNVPGVQIINRLRNANKDNVVPLLEYANPAIVLTGTARDTTYYFDVANPIPEALLLDSLANSLARENIKVGNHNKVKGNQRWLLLTHKSPVMTDIITSLLERSDNMFTEALLRAIAVNSSREPIDSEGVAVIDSLFTARGLDASGKFQYDGSGLARNNKAPVQFFADMLTYMASRRFGTKQLRLVDLMPRVGVNARIGTVMPETALSTHLAVKSGSMRDVQCYVGYYPAEEPQYAWAVLVNNWHGTRPNLKNMIDRLLIGIFDPEH